VQGEPTRSGGPVVLTVAHLDHNPQNCGLGNLVALCQRCHLWYDAAEHAKTAASRRRWRAMKAGQLELAL